MRKRIALTLLLAASAPAARAVDVNAGDCGTYEVSGRLSNPALGRFEVIVNEGSKGQFPVRVFGLGSERAFELVGSRVRVRGTADRPVTGLLKSLKDCKVLDLPDPEAALRRPVTLVEKAACAAPSPRPSAARPDSN